MHEIEIDGSERKIFRECIDDLRMGGKFETSKMMEDSTVYRMNELEEDEEEVEGTVDFNGGDKTAASIDDNSEPENDVFLPFFLSWLTSGSC